MKKKLGYALMAFVAASIAFAAVRGRRQPPPPGPAAPAPAAAPASDPTMETARKPQPAKTTVIARYCHGHARCASCLKIEGYSREAMTAGFQKLLDSGRLRFEVVDVEEPRNRHYIQDYGLYTKSLVLVAERGGQELRHKVLNDVWNHLDDKAAFLAYVKTETEDFLK